jgi:hypothetical protein
LSIPLTFPSFVPLQDIKQLPHTCCSNLPFLLSHILLYHSYIHHIRFSILGMVH